MIRKVLWISTVLCFIILVLTQHYFQKPLDTTDGFFLFLDLLIPVILLAILALPVSLLIACIPYKDKSYFSRLSYVVPISVIFLTIFFACAFIVSSRQKKYTNVEIPADIDCGDVHTGLFETSHSIIYRTDSVQTEIQKEDRSENVFRVRWLSDCEYELTDTDDLSVGAVVKIIGVSPQDYTCVVSRDGRVLDYVIKRTKK